MNEEHGELQKIFDDDPSARWTGWKNIALNLFDCVNELEKEADWLALQCEKWCGYKAGEKQGASKEEWRNAARKAVTKCQ